MPESVLELAHQLHGNAKALRSGFPRTFQMIYQRWDVIRVTFFLAEVVCVYWEISRWIAIEWNKSAIPHVELTSPTQPVEVPQGGHTPTTGGRLSETLLEGEHGTGVADAALPSTG